MSTLEKSGTQDKNVKFRDIQSLLAVLGFEYYGDNPENINIQPMGNKAKPYQVRQIRNYLLKYKLSI